MGTRLHALARRATAAIVVACGTLASPTSADVAVDAHRRWHVPPQVLPPLIAPDFGYGYPAYCRTDVRLFESLRYGRTPFCRERFRYRPGALECHQYVDEVCAYVLPGSAQLVEAYSPVDHAVVPCPDGPPPPMCRRLDFR